VASDKESEGEKRKVKGCGEARGQKRKAAEMTNTEGEAKAGPSSAAKKEGRRLLGVAKRAEKRDTTKNNLSVAMRRFAKGAKEMAQGFEYLAKGMATLGEGLERMDGFEVCLE
jgi:hypothetical protein